MGVPMYLAWQCLIQLFLIRLKRLLSTLEVQHSLGYLLINIL